MDSVKINGVSFNAKKVGRFKSAQSLMKELPHIFTNEENREELFQKVLDTVNPPKKTKKKDK